MKTIIKPEWLDIRFVCEEEDREVTIREYFSLLMGSLWFAGEGFSGKRPLGNSGWQSTLMEPLVKAGAVLGTITTEKYGSDDESDWDTTVEVSDWNDYSSVVQCLIKLAGKPQRKTLKKWNKSGLGLSDYLQPGDEINEALFLHMGGVVSPQYCSRTFTQMGEASREENGVLFYMSSQVVGDKYLYLGILPEFKQ